VVPFPITFTGNSDGMLMQWIGFDGKGDDALIEYPASGTLRAPVRPGAYWLVLSRGGFADTVADMALFVEHPMPNKMATGINGYHMGRWPKAADGAVPPGFIEVTERTSDFPLSPHLKLSDFVVHDAQDGFPKYLHVREPLLDKIELTVAEVAAMRGREPSIVRLNVASGFRSPAHNGVLSGSAQDSRHMYGDAADIAIDANNDGKLTEIDARLVAAAAEAVERKHPDLVGGIGLYITPDGAGWPYVHIDVRGRRARWRGGAKRGGAVDSLPADATFDSVATPVAGVAASPTTPPARTAADPAVTAPVTGRPARP
jgi:Peptidase M15